MSKTTTPSAIDAVLKKYGDGAILQGNQIVDVQRVKTGSLTLDLITGGGWGVGRIIEVYGPESSGKAQPLNAGIMTPTGWKTMRDMEVGSQVLTPSGLTASVTGVFPQGPQAVYNLATLSGLNTEATLDHLWKIRISRPFQEDAEIKVLSTEEILNLVNGNFLGDDITIYIPVAPVNWFEGDRYEVVTVNWEQVISIEDTGKVEPCQCISIDSEDKLYITDGYIVTHNTTLAIHSMIEAQKAFPHKKILVVDTEHALDRKYCEKLGLDMSKVYVTQPDNGEQALDIAEDMISTGEFSFVLVDSVATLLPKSELEGEMGDSAMGSQARLMSKGLRKLAGITNTTKTILFFTNQLRSKIGVIYGNPEITSGGNALKFYASIRVDIRKRAGDAEDGEIKDIEVTCKTVKNKLAPPFKSCKFKIRFGQGIDRTGEVLFVGGHLGIIEKKGNTYLYDGTKLGVGVKQARATLDDNPELLELIANQVMLSMDADLDNLETTTEDLPL
jgi:recombination protein RecA